ncbi:unnamed protein product [Ixodes persulcatus]
MLPGRWNEGGYGGPSGRRDYSRRWVRKPRRPGDLYEPPTDELSGAKLCLTLLFLLALGFTATEYYIQLLPLFREAYQKIHDKERVAEDANEPRAYNDRTGRIIEPHRAWMGFSEHWRSPYGALHVFSAFYMHGKDGTTKPHVKVTALLSPRLRHTCVVRARIVYLDYPHSFPTLVGVCRHLSSDAQQSDSSRSTGEILEPAVLEFPTGQKTDRIPTAITILLNGMDSQVWIPVRTFSMGPSREVIGVCVSATDRESALDMAEFLAFHQLIGVTKFIVYATANFLRTTFPFVNSSKLKVVPRNAILPWYKSAVLLRTTPSSAKRLMLEDCMFRSRSFVEFVALMNADELLVPRKNSSEAGRHRRFQLTGTLADVYLFERVSFCKNVSVKDGVAAISTLRSQSSIMCLGNFEWKPLVFRSSGPKEIGTRQSRVLHVPRKDFVLQKFESELTCSPHAGYIDTAAQAFARDLKTMLQYYYREV